jgi:hypothetical protein
LSSRTQVPDRRKRFLKSDTVMTPEQREALTTYCNCLQSAKKRLALVDAVTSGRLRIDHEAVDSEFACLQLRRALELIAFASVAAHKDIYSQAHADFATHWNAKKLLQKLEKLHPDFYPKPVRITEPDSPGPKRLIEIESDYLSKDDFVFLYNTCSEALHEWNPYRSDPRVVHFGHPVSEWVVRTRRLLEMHWISFVGTMDIFVVVFNGPDGCVHASYAQDRPPASPG